MDHASSVSNRYTATSFTMGMGGFETGLVPAIHAVNHSPTEPAERDARNKSEHDGVGE